MARRRFEPKLFLASLGIAAGVTGVAWAASVSVTGREAQNLPPAIESISPVRDATQAPSQSQVFVDLVPGYEAVLVIDGLELPTRRLDEISVPPGQQVELPPTAIFEPGNVTLTFTPTAGAPIETFDQGRHSAQVVYWKSEEGRSRARSFTWSFDVV